MKRIFVLLIAICTFCYADAQNFDEYFTDSTLRIDYVFSGNTKQQMIAVDKLNKMQHWYGKHRRLAELPIEGNGQITVRDHITQKVIYRNSFSTLFQEWLSYPEAETQTKSFENVFLIPMPRKAIDVTIDLRNNRREVMATLTHSIIPNDVLIRHIGEHPTPYITLQQAKDTSNCIHIAYVAEGYKPEEMQTFLNDAHIALEALFTHEPFKSLRDRFNIIAVEVPSQESGTSDPAHGVWKNTALHSNFDTFYSDRCLTTLHL